MGRKGVSKRKVSQTKSKPLSNDNASGSVSSALKAMETQPGKAFDNGKAATSSDSKKKTKKG
jgi:hypothetical protein